MNLYLHQSNMSHVQHYFLLYHDSVLLFLRKQIYNIVTKILYIICIKNINQIRIMNDKGKKTKVNLKLSSNN